MASLQDSINTITRVFYKWARCYGDSFTLNQREMKKLIQEEFGEAMEGLCDSRVLGLVSEHLEGEKEGMLHFNNYLEIISCLAKACYNYMETQERHLLPGGEDTMTLWGEERALREAGGHEEDGTNARRRRDSTRFPREVNDRRDRLPWEMAAQTHDLELSNDCERSRLIQNYRQVDANYEIRNHEERSQGDVEGRHPSLEDQPQRDERRFRDVPWGEESGRGCPSRPSQCQVGDERQQHSQDRIRRRDELNVEMCYDSECRGRDAEQGRFQEQRTTPRESLQRRQESDEDLQRESGNQRRYSVSQEGERRTPRQEPVLRNRDQRSQRCSESEVLEEEHIQRPSEARGRTPRQDDQMMGRFYEAQCLERVDERRRSQAYDAGDCEGWPRKPSVYDSRPLDRDAVRRSSLRRESARREDDPDRRQVYETEPIETEGEREDRFQAREAELRGDGQRRPSGEPRALGRGNERRGVPPFAPSVRDSAPRQQQDCECGDSLKGRRQPRAIQRMEREGQEDAQVAPQVCEPLARESGRQRYNESEDLGGQHGRRRPHLYEAGNRDGERRPDVARRS